MNAYYHKQLACYITLMALVMNAYDVILSLVHSLLKLGQANWKPASYVLVPAVSQEKTSNLLEPAQITSKKSAETSTLNGLPAGTSRKPLSTLLEPAEDQ